MGSSQSKFTNSKDLSVEFYIIKVNPLSPAYVTETQKDVWQYSFTLTAVKYLENTCKRINFQLS